MEHWVFWGCFGFSRGILGIFVRVPGCSGFSRRCSGVFRVFHTVPGVPECSGCSGVFQDVPVFRCSGVLVFLELLHAVYDVMTQIDPEGLERRGKVGQKKRHRGPTGTFTSLVRYLLVLFFTGS